jgi:hypothetical protein
MQLLIEQRRHEGCNGEHDVALGPSSPHSIPHHAPSDMQGACRIRLVINLDASEFEFNDTFTSIDRADHPMEKADWMQTARSDDSEQASADTNYPNTAC